MANDFKLPDAKERIDSLQRREKFQDLVRSPQFYAIIAAVVVIVGGLIWGGVYLLSNGSTDGTEPEVSNAATREEPVNQPAQDVTVETHEEVITESPPVITETTGEAEEEATEQPDDQLVTEAATQEVQEVASATGEPTEQSDVVEAETDEVVDEETQESETVETEVPSTSAPTETSATTGSVTDDTIDPSSLAGKIAVSVFNTGTENYDLYIVSSPGWQVPSQPFQMGASQPSFSPDGTSIVFRSWGGDENSYGQKLVIRSLTTSSELIITQQFEDARPHWANFDFPILYHTRPSGLSPQIHLQALWDGAINNPQGHRQVTDGVNPTWLSDGRIIYAADSPSGVGLYIINSDGSGKWKVTDTSDIVAPKGSPTGNQVVFSANDDLYLLTVGTEPSQPVALLTTPNQQELLPVWSPDGQFIAYAKAHQDNKWAVYVIRSDGTGETKLFDIPGAIDGKPYHIPDGKAFGWFEEQLAWGL